jgi:hypothetical protein
VDPATRTTPASCHVLEFSVGPGRARQGDLHAALDPARFADAFRRRYDDDHIAYLVLCYGAILHLWTVQAGELTTGVDLHPMLRTGDPRLDRAVTAILAAGQEGEVWELFDRVCRLVGFQTMAAVRVVAHILHLRDRAGSDPAAEAELDEAMDAIDDGRVPLVSWPGAADPACFDLDWAALAAAAPPLREPLLRPRQRTPVTWSPGGAPPAGSYLRHVDGVHLGLIDIESGDEDFD